MEYERTLILPEGMTWAEAPRSLRDEMRHADLVIARDGTVLKDRYGREGGKASAKLMEIARRGGGVLT